MVTLSTEQLDVRLGRHLAVRGVNLTMAPGQLIGVIGPNGAGKSTLVRALLGLVKPAAGRALLDGTPVERLSRQAVARSIAYLPQGQTLHWPLAVERLVALGRLPHLGPLSRLTADDEAAIEDAMARADVTGFKGRIATELSGGERARVLLARALVVQAPLLLADEPIAGLDPDAQLLVLERLRARADAGGGVLVSLHDLTLAARIADRVVVLDAGRVVADGAPVEALSPAVLRTTFNLDGTWLDAPDGPLLGARRLSGL